MKERMEFHKPNTTFMSLKLEMEMYMNLKKYCAKKDIYMSVLIRKLISKELINKNNEDYNRKNRVDTYKFNKHGVGIK